MGKMLRAITREGSANIMILNATDIVKEAVGIHKTTPTASAALGRVLVATSIIGSMLKDKGNTVTVNFRGNGSAGSILAVSDYMGNVRGYIQNPDADAERLSNGKLNVGAIVGKGNLNIIKDVGEKDPYVGICEIVSGEIAEDIASYFAQSEQVPTACSLGVLIDKDGSPRAAGGVIVQALPFANDGILAKIEENMKELTHVSDLFDRGLSNEEIAEIAFKGIEYDLFDEYDVSYKCNCSYERTGNALLSLSPYELWNMLIERKVIEVSCHFCHKKYEFTGDDIEKLRKEKEQRAEENKEE